MFFDTSRAPHYGELSGLRASAEHSRVDDSAKRHAADFALWKFSPHSGPQRQLEWESPWGIGFPGWHIECSAMASRYLGSQFEIHTGGIDHVAVHHTNEIVQAEHALGVRPWVKYWMHGAWLTMEGAKIAKSAGLAPNLDDVAAIGIGPAAFRYYLMTAHYRSPLDLSLEALRAANTAFERLSHFIARHRRDIPVEAEQDFLDGHALATRAGRAFGVAGDPRLTWARQFYDALFEDLDAPRAIAVLWCIFADSSMPAADRAHLIAALGGVLGLDWKETRSKDQPIDPEITALVAERERARATRDFSRADALRGTLASRGFAVEDSPSGPIVSRLRAQASAASHK
jgi:cysteinyl-tRNA synthetase